MSVNTVLAKKLEGLNKKEEAPLAEQLTIKSNSWDRTSLDFGIVAPGSKQKYSFQYLGDSKIKSVVAGCGCTSTKNENGEISGFLTLGKDWSYSKDNLIKQEKTIKVTLEDESEQTLLLKCTVDKSAW